MIVAERPDGSGAMLSETVSRDIWALAVAGSLGQIAEYVGPALWEAQSDAIHLVNELAGKKRQSFITWIPGQEMLYLAKEATARAWLADTDPAKDADSYPLLAAEIGITADTADGLASLWVGMADAWRTAAAQIEAARLGAVKQIEQAADNATVAAVVASYRAALAV